MKMYSSITIDYEQAAVCILPIFSGWLPHISSAILVDSVVSLWSELARGPF
jgi:hypothetical protein